MKLTVTITLVSILERARKLNADGTDAWEAVDQACHPAYDAVGELEEQAEELLGDGKAPWKDECTPDWDALLRRAREGT